MDFFFCILPMLLFAFLIVFTKLHDGAVSVGDVVFCGVVSCIPIVNIVASLYLFFATIAKHRVFEVVLF